MSAPEQPEGEDEPLSPLARNALFVFAGFASLPVCSLVSVRLTESARGEAISDVGVTMFTHAWRGFGAGAAIYAFFMVIFLMVLSRWFEPSGVPKVIVGVAVALWSLAHCVALAWVTNI
ncbi:MAG: hypothetical protein CMH57_03475 [Myxococcales bacterium]|nr:hypothetical protein [Myxococcales bacterium]